jgi:hypothetical protein
VPFVRVLVFEVPSESVKVFEGEVNEDIDRFRDPETGVYYGYSKRDVNPDNPEGIDICPKPVFDEFVNRANSRRRRGPASA